MSRGAFSTSNYFIQTIASVNVPVTLSCWVYPTGYALQTVFGLNYYTGSGTTMDQLMLMTSTGGFRAYTAGIAGVYAEYSYSTTNAWVHVATVFAASNSRIVYVNGAASSTNTDNINLDSQNRATIGCRINNSGTPSLAFGNGYAAHAAYWNVALTAGEVMSLAKKASPLLIRPASLQSYYPMWRGDASGDEIDLLNATKITEVGTISERTNAIQMHIG